MTRLPRLVIILPELQEDSSTHYAHYFSLLREVARIAELAVVVERGGTPSLQGIEVIPQRRSGPVARACELAWICVKLRRRGFRAAYGSYSPYFGVVVGLLGRVIGLRTAFWHCRSDFFDRRIERRLGPGRTLRQTLPLVASLHLSRVVVTGTPGLAALYSETFHLPRRKVRVVPNDIDLHLWQGDQPRSREARARMLFVHRLSEHKGSRLLPDILRLVLERIPGATLVVAGDGPDGDRLRKELAPEIAAGTVEVCGYVSNSEVRRQMAKSTILIMPSLEEGFPRVLLEAMASGLAFVASDVGGVAEIVSPEAREELVPPGNTVAFAHRIIRLLDDDRLRGVLAEAGCRWVERYDVSRVAPELVRVVGGISSECQSLASPSP